MVAAGMPDVSKKLILAFQVLKKSTELLYILHNKEVWVEMGWQECNWGDGIWEDVYFNSADLVYNISWICFNHNSDHNSLVANDIRKLASLYCNVLKFETSNEKWWFALQ